MFSLETEHERILGFVTNNKLPTLWHFDFRELDLITGDRFGGRRASNIL
jgi:hypothetical protein